MTKKTLEELQIEHAKMCAEASDLDIEVPADLTVDFDTAEVGDAVVASLRKMIDAYYGTEEAIASAANQAQDARPKKKKRPKVQKAKGAKPKAVESKVTDTTKSKKTAKKKVAAKKVAKKTTPKKALKKRVLGDNKSAKVIAMLQRKGGATRKQVLALTSWPSVSLQALAKHAGVKLKVDDSKRPFTYSA